MRDIWKYQPEGLSVEEQPLGEASDFLVRGSDESLRKFLRKFLPNIGIDDEQMLDMDFRSVNHLWSVVYRNWCTIQILRPDQKSKHNKDNVGLNISVGGIRLTDEQLRSYNDKLREAIESSK